MNKEFIENIISMHGIDGEKWLHSLPAIIKKYENEWGFQAQPPFELTYNYVAPVKMNNGELTVLKIGFAGDREFKEGVEALRIFDGQGSVKLLQANEQEDVILMEKVDPGVLLLKVSDEEEKINIATDIMKQLWKDPPKKSRLSKLVDWGGAFSRIKKQFNGNLGPFPKKLLEQAEDIFNTYAGSNDQSVVLHGDLHFENILSSHRNNWLAIDPKGMIGDKAYEAGILLYQPRGLIKKPDIQNILVRRIDILSDSLQLQKNRVRDWGIARAVLSGLWSYEDHGKGWENPVEIAKILSEIHI